MTDERVLKLIREAHEKNLTTLDLSKNVLKELPLEIIELKDLTILNLSNNELTELSSKIAELKNLTELDLSVNKLTQLPPEIGELKNLKRLYLYNNPLIQQTPEIKELKSLTELVLSDSQLKLLFTEVKELKNLTKLTLFNNQLTQPPSEIWELRNLTKLLILTSPLTKLPPEIGMLKNLKLLSLFSCQLTQLPSEIGELKNLTELDLSYNKLSQLPPEIGELENLTKLDLFGNPLISPPPEIISRGREAIFTYLKQSRTKEINEAKLILVGNGDVGKTCLAYRLINDKFLENAKKTEGINITKWEIPAPESGHSEIKLNIWDFGGQEIYHATHQFFLTKRSIYLLVWNARKTKDYDQIYYWLHTIEAFGENSPVILVMSKMNEHKDDLNQQDLKNRFPQITGFEKIDSFDGRGIVALKENIGRIAWDSPLMKAKWVDSWFKVRQILESYENKWISYDKFCEICMSEGLNNDNINVLDDYLHDLGVTLHFKDTLALKNIVILKPQWATDAFYKILSTQSVIDNEGELSQNELSKIWDNETYPPSIYPHLMDLMNKFELAYELPDRSSYLVPQLLPVSEQYNYEWSMEDELCLYYSYDYFLPPGIIPRFIVRMHQNIEKKRNRLPFCWREGAVLSLQNSRALVKVMPDERQIVIRISGNNKRGAMGAICNQLDQVNASMKKISVSKLIPCNCSENCTQRYSYEKLLKAEMENREIIQCHESYESVFISSLLDGYNKKEDRMAEYHEILRNNEINVTINPIISPTINPIFSPTFVAKDDANPKAEANIDSNVSVNIDRKTNKFYNAIKAMKAFLFRHN